MKQVAGIALLVVGALMGADVIPALLGGHATVGIVVVFVIGCAVGFAGLRLLLGERATLLPTWAMTPKKKCPACREAVALDARRCPHCTEVIA